MKILITNAVPLNGGDEAILRAAHSALMKRWPHAQISVLCRNVAQSRALLPDLDLAPDLDAPAAALRPKFLDKLATRLRRPGIVKRYRAADIVVSAPGGFLHDFYPIEERLRGFELALALGKPFVIFAQSIGPFWKPESIRRIREVLNRVTRICVRDAISREHLLGCGVEDARIAVTADAAFLWRTLAPELFQAKSGAALKVGLCFREWPLRDETAVAATIAKAVALSGELLREPDRRLVFLSTCQGIPGYLDDSDLAVRVVAELPPELRARCEVDHARRNPRDLISALGACDAFIGMRLHACVLAMLGGTPAMGLGYEDKTEGIYRRLGFEKWQVRFDRDADAWLECARGFLKSLPQFHAELAPTLDRAAALAAHNVDAVASALPNP